MGKNLKRFVLGAIYCTAFFLPLVLSSPANSQSLEWVKLLGTASNDYGFGVAADTSGNIYLTGYTDGALGQTNAGGDDVFLAKYDSSGTMKWVSQLGTASDEAGYGVAVDTSGNIYVTGYTNGDLGSKTTTQVSDAFLAKYDSSGTIQWVKVLGSLNGAIGYGVTVDTSGNIYITGAAFGDLDGEASAGGMDTFLAKYDGTGARQWVKLLGTASADYGYGVTVDTSGNIYVTGYTGGALDGDTNVGGADIFLAKYDSTGTMQWVKMLGSASDETGHGVAVDTSGNIYVTGYTGGNLDGNTNTGNYDIFLAKYDGTGAKQWVKMLGTASDDRGYGVAVDTSGDVYVTGYTTGNLDSNTIAGGTDAFLAKYDGTGKMLGVKLLGTAGYDYGYDVAVDTSGDIYVTGYTTGNLGGDTNAGSYDIFLAKYTWKSESFPWEIFYPAFIKKKINDSDNSDDSDFLLLLTPK